MNQYDLNAEAEVPDCGYRWMDARLVDEGSGRVYGKPTRLLVVSDPDAESDEINPLTDTGLFFRFAQLEGEEEILAFANECGWLGGELLAVPANYSGTHAEKVEIVPGVHEWTNDHINRFYGDTIGLWLSEVGKIRRVIDLWKAALASDKKTIEKLVVVTEPSEVNKKTLGADLIGKMRGSNVMADVSKYSRKNFLASVARAVVLAEISGAISETDQVYVALESTPKAEWGTVRLSPLTLRCGLWMQFAAAVTGQKRFNQCTVCGKMLEVSPTAYRTNRTLCSNACKSKAYRLRKTRKPK